MSAGTPSTAQGPLRPAWAGIIGWAAVLLGYFVALAAIAWGEPGLNGAHLLAVLLHLTGQLLVLGTGEASSR